VNACWRSSAGNGAVRGGRTTTGVVRRLLPEGQAAIASLHEKMPTTPPRSRCTARKRRSSESTRGEDAELVALRVAQNLPRNIALADIGEGGAQSP
jgi:hypothetical protein